MFDNGYRADGSQRGNPGLGALCEPVALKPLSTNVVQFILDTAEDVAVGLTGQPRATLRIEAASGLRFKLPPPAASLPTDEAAKKEFCRSLYASFFAYSKFISTGRAQRSFELAWGGKLLETLARNNRGRTDFASPFPTPDDDDVGDYDPGKLKDALGALSVSLKALQAAGLLGRWEISVPFEDDGKVVTIAIDDDITLGAQRLLREQRCFLYGSVTEVLTIAALDRAGIKFRMDSYLLDPSTTRIEDYNPTQLLISVSQLRDQ
jgi:hypothetical protein